MKLLTKRLLAVALTIAMTLGMAMNAMALDGVSDKLLKDADIDPDKAEWLSPWIDFYAADDEEAPSKQTKTERVVVVDEDGNYLVDLSRYAKSGYTNFAIVHDGEDGIKIHKGTTWKIDNLSPFRLVGEKKSSSSSSSSSKSKSPKTGMDNSWILWLMAAGVFAGASVVSYSRKRG